MTEFKETEMTEIEALTRELKRFKERISRLDSTRRKYKQKVLSDPEKNKKRLEYARIYAKKYRANAKARKVAELAAGSAQT